MLFINVIENGFRIRDFSIDNCVSFVPIITYTYTYYIYIYILYYSWPTASIENVINNHFENVYSVMTLLWANNEIENNKLCVKYL